MALRIEGGCRCGAVRFAVDSRGPVPFLHCYCTICRKTAGGGGYAINLHADKPTLEVTGETAVYRALLDDGDGGCKLSTAERHFCPACASALWVYSPEYPELLHPFASAIDTELPRPPSRVHMMLAFKAEWVDPHITPGDTRFDRYPEQTLEAWHRTHGLWRG